MPNYKEKTVTGTKHQRAYRVIVENSYGRTPEAIFEEEELTLLDDESFTNKTCGRIQMTFDPGFVVPLINPLINEPLLDENNVQKMATLEELYVIFYSLYFEAARLRDMEQES